MGKYEPLAQFLGGLKEDSWSASFDQIESKLGFELPPSARKYPQWWSNEQGKGHSQKEGWQTVGWKTVEVDMREKKVRFARNREHQSRSSTASMLPTLEELRCRAMEISGISDRDELERAALSALVLRETAQYISALGGSMPDAEAAPRRRPSW